MDDDVVESSQDNVAEEIKPINRDTVHKICSGQVVLSLAVAVKELVENALDASATNIEVKLKEYGSESVEVSDNGSGIKKENFQALTLKHFTSKIKEFSDLENVKTLGFRGEALSSLCALSDLSVITKHASAEYATKITYDHNGKIVSQTPTARTQGTTVCLSNLFSTLPVRRKEFVKNLKREFNKMCQLLYAYCLVAKGVKFSCTNATSKNSKTTLAVTQGLSTVRDNIVAIFGSKQIATLIDVELVRPEEDILEEYGIKMATGDPIPFEFEFFISSVIHGNGRSTSDRQFYYINSRPCEPAKITKLVNEIYRQFNGGQYPFVYLNILTETSQVDVNVTPDKRQIFLEKEKLLLATIKATLLSAFKQFPSTYKIQNANVTRQLDVYQTETPSRGSKRNLGENSNDEVNTKSFLDAFRKKPRNEETSIRAETKPTSDNNNKRSNLKNLDFFKIVSSQDTENTTKENFEEILACKLMRENINKSNVSVKNLNDAVSNEYESIVIKKETEEYENDSFLKTITTDEGLERAERNFITINTSMQAISEALSKSNLDSDEDLQVKFRSQIAPSDNETAEKELQKNISKDMFSKMEIVGQFNLGFIIAKLDNDLFIIDQHASDEKYNFEQLQESTVMENQMLVNPKPLQLTAANESLLLDKLEIFNKNGFKFKINEEAEATKKISLTAIPVSKNYVFGKDDIDEMLFMLQDDTNKTTVRPSRLRAMFALRACRKSVMVGRALSRHEMKKLVEHMGKIEQPWNCPHGRPTMRHLINLSLIKKD